MIENLEGFVELEGTALSDTDLAVAFDFGVDRIIWLPKSMMEDWPDIGENGTVLVQEWIAEEKGLL